MTTTSSFPPPTGSPDRLSDPARDHLWMHAAGRHGAVLWLSPSG